MRNRTGAILAFGVLMRIATPAAARRRPGGAAPKVVLIGDSIRLGYAPNVAERLAGKATVVSPPANGGDSANVLEHLEEWVIREKPDVVHLNCGLHDLKRSAGRTGATRSSRTGTRRTSGGSSPGSAARPAPRWSSPTRRPSWTSGTPGGGPASIGPTPTCAATTPRPPRSCGEAGVPVHDLYWVVEQAGPERMLGPDGTHYTPEGYDRLAEAVADCVAAPARDRPLSAAAGARLRPGGRRGVPQGRRRARPASPGRLPTARRRRVPRPRRCRRMERRGGRASWRRSGSRSATSRRGRPRPASGSSPASSGAATRWRRSPSTTASTAR